MSESKASPLPIAPKLIDMPGWVNRTLRVSASRWMCWWPTFWRAASISSRAGLRPFRWVNPQASISGPAVISNAPLVRLLHRTAFSSNENVLAETFVLSIPAELIREISLVGR